MGNRVALPFSMKEIKVTFLGQIEQVKVTIDLKWSKFEKKLCSTYNLDGPLYARYHEDDNTPVFIETSSQLRSYLRSGKHQPLDIFPLYNGSSLPLYIPYGAYSIKDVSKPTQGATKTTVSQPTIRNDHSVDSAKTKPGCMQYHYIDNRGNQYNEINVNHRKKSNDFDYITADGSADTIDGQQNDDDGSFEQWSTKFILEQLALSTLSSDSFHSTATDLDESDGRGILAIPSETCSHPINKIINPNELQIETQYLWSSLETDIFKTFIVTPTNMYFTEAIEDIADHFISMASPLALEVITKLQDYKLIMKQSPYWSNVTKILSKMFT